MTAASSLFPPAQFFDVKFPFVDRSVKGSLRRHVHVYPHSPGGDLESLSRGLYEIKFTCDFHDVFAAYPQLYPAGLNKMRGLYEAETSGPLVVPGVGTITAKLVDFEQRLIAKIQSGERVSLDFMEDEASVPSQLVTISPQVLAVRFDGLTRAFPASAKLSLLDKLKNLVNAVTGAIDQGELYASLVNDKLSGILDECLRLDNALDIFNAPVNFSALDALHELQAAALQLSTDVLKFSRPIDTFVTQGLMTIAEVSVAIYGDTGGAVQIMQLNPIGDAFAIPANTRLRYYA